MAVNLKVAPNLILGIARRPIRTSSEGEWQSGRFSLKIRYIGGLKRIPPIP